MIASSLSTGVSSRVLLSDEALTNAEYPGLDPQAPEPEDDRAAAREAQLEKALAQRARGGVDPDGIVEIVEIDEIVENNVFCPSCKPTTEPAEPAPDAGGALPQTQLPLALLATMESDDPLLSMASIRDTELDRTGVFGINEPIRPGVFVAGIARGAVVLRVSGRLQALGFPDPEPPASKQKKGAKPKKKRKRGSREIPGAREAIACKGNACTVDRQFVEKLVANPRLLARQAKILPAVQDGRTRGFRLHRVRRGTVPRLLGLRNGDTLLAINGTDLNSMDQAITLYTRLRRASELSVVVERKGKVFEKQISIR